MGNVSFQGTSSMRSAGKSGTPPPTPLPPAPPAAEPPLLAPPSPCPPALPLPLPPVLAPPLPLEAAPAAPAPSSRLASSLQPRRQTEAMASAPHDKAVGQRRIMAPPYRDPRARCTA